MDTTKKEREAKFLREHTLTPEAMRKLIEDKFARAKAYHLARHREQGVLEKNR
jgi:hypothetical protein